MNPLIVLAGLFVGVCVGATGVGGSSLVAPLLILLLGVQPAIAVGTDLLYSVPTRLFGTLIHSRQQTVNWPLVRGLLSGGVPGALAGLAIFEYLRRHLPLSTLNLDLQRCVGVTLVLVALMVLALPLVEYLRQRGPKKRGDTPIGKAPRTPAPLLIALLGGVVALLVSLTSLGSGSLLLPLLILLVPRADIRRLVGADIAFAAVIVPIATIGHLQMGNVDIPLALQLALGAIPGVLLGSRLLKILPELAFRPVLAGVLLFASTRLL